MTEYAQHAKDIIEQNLYMTIATVSPEGRPWISPVFFVYDDQYNLYWVSSKDARHSQYVRNNGHVAIVIFDSSAYEGAGDGVYVEADAHELSDTKEIERVMPVWNQRAQEEDFKIKGLSNVLDDAVWRIYKATPSKIFKLTEGEYRDGQYVDKKVEIKLR